MKKIEKFMLPEHTNKLYTEEAISSVSLTRDVADKINELVDAYNALSENDLTWKHEQEGRIEKGVLFMKDNLLNSLHELLDLLGESFIDARIVDNLGLIEKRLNNLLSSYTDGATNRDAEVIDGRIAYDGVIYENIGVAIREQLTEIHKIVKENIDFIVTRAGRVLITDWSSIRENTTLNTTHGKVETLNGYWLYNDFIEVDASKNLFIFSPVYPISMYVHYYDKNKVYLGNVYTNVSEVPALPLYAHYIRPVFIMNVNPAQGNLTLKEGTPYSKTTLNLHDTIINSDNCDFFIKDIFNAENARKGYALDANSGAWVAFENRTTTDFINVDGVKHITSNFPFYVCFYDEMFNFLSDVKDNSYHRAGTYAIPETAIYIRLTLITESDEEISTFSLSNGEFTAQSQAFLNPKFQLQSNFNTWYKDKKVVAFGDSITELNIWQPYLTTYFGCNMVNCGVGSSTVANNGLKKTVNGVEINSWMCHDDRINLIPEDCDVILIFGGANDAYSSSIELGDVKTDMSDATFKGAYSLMIKKLVNKFPNARLISMTPLSGRTDTEKANQDKQFTIRSLCMNDFAKAVKEVSNYYGIPCIDVNGETGISTLNHTTYIADIIHPNANGGKLIANAVINGMKRFEPITF